MGNLTFGAGFLIFAGAVAFYSEKWNRDPAKVAHVRRFLKLYRLGAYATAFGGIIFVIMSACGLMNSAP